MSTNYSFPSRPDTFPDQYPLGRIDYRCVPGLTVTTEQSELDPRRVQTTVDCNKCGGCAVAFAGDLGGKAFMDKVGTEFCAPNQWQTEIVAEVKPASVSFSLEKLVPNLKYL